MISFRQADLIQSLDKAAHPVVGLVFKARGVKDQSPNFTSYEYYNNGIKLPELSTDKNLLKTFKNVPSITVTKHRNPNEASGWSWSEEHTPLANFVWSKGFDFKREYPVEYSGDDAKEVIIWVVKR
jgi:hypothetical protein